MKFRFISILFLLFLTMFSVQAETTLTSCGMSSGWISGETYILDFDEIPSNYGNGWCFYINSADVNDITFKGTNQTIIDNSQLNYLFYIYQSTIDGLTIKDFDYSQPSLMASTSFSNFLHYRVNSGTDILSNVLIENVETTNIGQFLAQYSSLSSTTNNNIDGFTLQDVKVNNAYYFHFTNSPNNNANNFDFWDFEANNVFIETTLGWGIIDLNYADAGDDYWFVSIADFTFEDFIYFGDIDGTLLYNQVDNSNNFIIVEESSTYTDSNNDNIVISSLHSGQNSFPSIIVQVLGVNYISSIVEATDLHGLETFENVGKNVYLNDETIPSVRVGGVNTNPNFEDSDFLGVITLDEMFDFQLFGNGINCFSFDSQNCLFQDLNTFTAQRTNDYRGLINLVGNNQKVNGIEFSKTGSNNAHIISNVNDNLKNNVSIQHNQFTKFDNQFNDGTNHFIKLNYNNILIKNNSFDTINSIAGNYEFLDIDGTSPSSNHVTENTFEVLDGFGSGSSRVFSNNAETKFYNNYLDSNTIVSVLPIGNLEVNPLIPIEYNNKVYYFQIGNYYESNSACVDSNSDDICDSAFQSGGVNDEYPLAVYPYDYLSNLNNALFVVDELSFNITQNIIDNQTFELSSLDDIVTIEFEHDSDFQDLSCDVVLDGVVINSFSNVLSFESQQSLINGWTEKTYSLRSECYNEITYQSSDEVNFNIVLTSTNGEDDGGNNSISSDGVQIGDEFSLNLLNSDVSESSDNLLEFMSVVETPLGYVFIFAVVLMVLAMLGLMFSFVRYMIR